MNQFNPTAPPSSSSSVPQRENGVSHTPLSPETVRIRKYPNRRLYDTSRSRHLTHDGVISLIRDGKTVQVTDSRSGADITNIVLLQIMVERDPAKVQALPSALVHRAMRSDESTLRTLGEHALGAWKSSPTSEAPSRPSSPPTSNGAQRAAPTPSFPQRVAPVVDVESNGRPKAKAKRLDA